MIQLLSEINELISDSIDKHYYFDEMISIIENSIEEKIKENVTPLDEELNKISILLNNTRLSSKEKLLTNIEKRIFSDKKTKFINWRYSIWSALLIKSYGEFENQFYQLSNFVRIRKKVSLLQSDLRDKGIERSMKYLKLVASIPLSLEESEEKEYKLLNNIRNILVHNDSVLKRNLIGDYIDTNLAKYINNIPSLSINNNHQVLIEKDYVKYAYNLLYNMFLRTCEDVNENLQC